MTPGFFFYQLNISQMNTAVAHEILKGDMAIMTPTNSPDKLLLAWEHAWQVGENLVHKVSMIFELDCVTVGPFNLADKDHTRRTQNGKFLVQWFCQCLDTAQEDDWSTFTVNPLGDRDAANQREPHPMASVATFGGTTHQGDQTRAHITTSSVADDVMMKRRKHAATHGYGIADRIVVTFQDTNGGILHFEVSFSQGIPGFDNSVKIVRNRNQQICALGKPAFRCEETLAVVETTDKHINCAAIRFQINNVGCRMSCQVCSLDNVVVRGCPDPQLRRAIMNEVTNTGHTVVTPPPISRADAYWITGNATAQFQSGEPILRNSHDATQWHRVLGGPTETHDPDWIDSQAPYTYVQQLAQVHDRSRGDILPFRTQSSKRVCRVGDGSMLEARRLQTLPMSTVPELEAVAPDPHAHLRVFIHGMPTFTGATPLMDSGDLMTPGEDLVAPAEDPSLEPATTMAPCERPDDWASQVVEPEQHPIITTVARSVLDKPERADWLSDEDRVRFNIQTWQNRVNRIMTPHEFQCEVISFALDLTENDDIEAGMNMLAMFHQGWVPLMGCLGPGRLFATRIEMRDSMIGTPASHDDDPRAWYHWKKVSARISVETEKLNIQQRKLQDTQFGKFNKEPRPSRCDLKCDCREPCIKVFTHVVCSCSKCYERDLGKPALCKGCERPLMNYNGPGQSNQLCPNCDAGCDWKAQPMAEPRLPADAVTPLAPTEPAEPLCNCGWRIAACGACGMGYAQRAQQSTPGRVYADVQTFGACSSGPVVRTLDLATSLVTQVQRLDDNGATSQQRTLPVPTPVSDDEPEWEADGTMLQWLNRGTEDLPTFSRC